MVSTAERAKTATIAAPLALSLMVASSLAACGLDGGEELFGGAAGTSGTTTTGGPSSTGTGGAGTGGGATTTGTGGGATTTGTGGGATTTGTGGATTGTGGAGGTPISCGNGVADPGEACDGADLGGKSCNDFGFSNPDGLTCDANCQLVSTGCAASCNGTLEPGEVCDGQALNGHNCVELGFANPNGLVCANCQLDAAGCKANCNNNQIEPGEVCDGAKLGGKSCTDFMFTDPAGLKCEAGCKGLDPSGCKASCNGTVEPGEPCDGQNLNGHSCVEFGFMNPAGLACAACALDPAGCMAVCGNGKLEPGEQCEDGNMVANDGCGVACNFEATSCGTAAKVALGFGTLVINATTVGGGAHTGTQCQSAAGPDRVFAVTPSGNGFLTASLSRPGTKFDSVLYASASCVDAGDNTSILCADSYDPVSGQGLDGGEVLSFRAIGGQTYFIFVDGFANDDEGDFKLTLDLSLGTDCNDPVPIPIEAGTPMTLLGSTTGLSSAAGGTCSISSGVNPDVVYRVTRPSPGPLTVQLPSALTDYNSVLYARSLCNSNNSQIACSNVGGNGGEILNLPNLVGGTPVYVWVDGSSANNTPSGNYGVTLTP